MQAEWYWDLANGITAFSVAQSLAFLFAMASAEQMTRFRAFRGWVLLGIALAALVQTAAVILCHWAYATVAKTEFWETMAILTTVGRVSAIVGYAACIGGFFRLVAWKPPL